MLISINLINLFWNIIIIILITMSLLLWYFSYIRTSLKTQLDQKPISVMVYPLPLDIQFSKENFPSFVFNQLFTGPNPWIGGFSLSGDQDQRVKPLVV